MANAEPKKTDKPKTVFVIAPIEKLNDDGVDFAKLCLEQMIRPAAAESGGYAVPERSDDHHKPGSVTGKIVAAILDADVCVADLTGRNPNVMYEVAIAHAAGKPVILLQQEPGGPPFDFADERVIHYGLRVDQANAARTELVEHFKAAHEDEEDELLARTMNPVRQLFSQLRARAEASEPERAVLAELQAVRSEVREVSRDLARRRPRTDASEQSMFADIDVELVGLGLRLSQRDRLPVDSYRKLMDRIGNASPERKMELLTVLTDLDFTESPKLAQAAAVRQIDHLPAF